MFQTDKLQGSILIADDNPNNLNVLRKILTDQGYKVYPVPSGELALKVVQKSQPDIILLDIMMPPGMDGYEVCARLKSDEQTRDIPVLFISAPDETVYKVKAFEAGCADYIVKPFQAEEVSARVRTHLNLRYMQKQLLEQNRQLQFQAMLLEQIKDGIAAVDMEGRITYINGAAAGIKGKTPDELIGKKACVFGESPAVKKKVLQNTLKHGKWQGTISDSVTNGTRRTMEVRTWLVYDTDRKPTGMIGIGSDVTEKNQVTDALRQSETRYRELFEAMSSGVAVCEAVNNGKNFVFREFNSAGEKIEGIKRENIIGKPVTEVFPGVRALGLLEAFQRVWRTGMPEIFPPTFYSDNQRTGWRENRIYKLPSGEIVSVYDDVAEKIKAQQELVKAKEAAEAANHAKSDFMANMSHEIRTPLNAVLGFSEILMNEAQNVRQKAFLENIYLSGKALLSLMEDILDLSKIEAGRLELQPEPLSIRELLNEIEVMFFRKVRKKGLNFKIIIHEDTPDWLLLDRVRFRQVLINLADNAVKFTHQGYVEMRVRGEGSEVRGQGSGGNTSHLSPLTLIIEIADTGIGIPQDQQIVIFESFQQQKGQKSGEYAGTGLGLSITKKLIQMMNGNISVQSEAGKGSIFRIILSDVRTVEQPDTVKASSKPDDTETEFRPATIMIVDDVASNRELIREYLKDAAFSVIEAESGDHALSLLEKENIRPDLILMDLKMPGRNGYEVTEIIKNSKLSGSVPVIALTASAIKKDEPNIRKLFDGYLHKPVSKTELLSEIKKFLSFTGGKTLPAQTVEKTELPEETKKNLPEILKILQKKFMPRWKEIQEVFFINDITDFAESLKDFAIKYHIPFLTDYSQRLYDNAWSINIEEMESLMAEFPSVVDEIKKQK
ncbi:MAG: hypothetical protein BWK80_11085 [Desulfobacteraceae bacterium IS3]|nr:MAG: hypothetical protein BWK80_11085 [Desulfobacteraceae bacterium IS3]